MANDVYTINVKVDVQDKQELNRMISELERLAGAAPRAQKAQQQFNKGLRQTQIQARTSGRAVQNASYQIQDMIVQISGGVDPLRSFSQQLPQLFINAGKVGAGLGLIAAALPLIIQAFSDTEIGAGNLITRLGKLNEELGDFTKMTETLDMKGWVESFNELDGVGKQLASTLLDIRVQAKELQLESLIAEWSAFGNVLSGNMGDIQIKSMADNLGIAAGEMEELISLVNSVDGNILADPVVLSRMIEILGDGGKAAASMLEQLEALRATQASIERARGTAGQAAGGENIATDKDAEAAAKAAAAAAKAYEAELQRLYKVYQTIYPEQVKFFEAVKDANAAMEAGFITAEEYALRTQAAAEELTGSEETDRITAMFEETAEAGKDFSNNMVEQVNLMDDAIGLFDKSFDTMLDGVLMGTQSLSDGFKDMAKVIIAQMLKLAAYKGIAALFSGSAGSGGIGDAIYQSFSASAKGNAFSGGSIVPMAKGGIVNGPTVFPMANGMGLMGEAGPEAVMPLSRNSKGELGVKGGTNVVINNLAPGVSVQPRQTDDGITIEVIMDQVANAVRQGGNAIANSLEDSYQLGRGGATY